MFLFLDFTLKMTIAIKAKNRLIHSKLKTSKQISEVMITEIDSQMKLNKLKMKNLKAIYVITGPGSFTGVRSSITYAKITSLVLKIPVLGISKFKLLNKLCVKAKKYARKTILIHHKENLFYMQKFTRDNPKTDPKLIKIEEDFFKNIINNSCIIYNKKEVFRSMYKSIDMKQKSKLYYVNDSLLSPSSILKKTSLFENNPKPLYIKNY